MVGRCTVVVAALSLIVGCASSSSPGPAGISSEDGTHHLFRCGDGTELELVTMAIEGQPFRWRKGTDAWTVREVVTFTDVQEAYAEAMSDCPDAVLLAVEGFPVAQDDEGD